MTINRRTALKLGVGTSTLPLLNQASLLASGLK